MVVDDGGGRQSLKSLDGGESRRECLRRHWFACCNPCVLFGRNGGRVDPSFLDNATITSTSIISVFLVGIGCPALSVRTWRGRIQWIKFYWAVAWPFSRLLAELGCAGLEIEITSVRLGEGANVRR